MEFKEKGHAGTVRSVIEFLSIERQRLLSVSPEVLHHAAVVVMLSIHTKGMSGEAYDKETEVLRKIGAKFPRELLMTDRVRSGEELEISLSYNDIDLIFASALAFSPQKAKNQKEKDMLDKHKKLYLMSALRLDEIFVANGGRENIGMINASVAVLSES